MKLLVTGGTGFVGSYLVPRLLARGHEVSLLVRGRAPRTVEVAEGLTLIKGDPMRDGPWWDAVGECDAAVNLIGESIRGRWNEAKKARIRESRLRPLTHLIRAIPTTRPFKLLSASAVGYYGDAGDRLLEEISPPGSDFLARMARDWEAQALTAEGGRTQVALLRFGMVLGADGGAFDEMLRALRRRIGGVIGRGSQWVSWIHQEDLALATLFVLEHPDLDGPFNFGSPEPRPQADLVGALGRQLRLPTGLPTPVRAVRLALGGFADALVFSQRMTPRNLLAAGFEFRYPTLDQAYSEILARQQIT